MKRSLIRLACGIAVLALGANPAWAQRGRHNGTVSTPLGTFSAAEMAQAGGDSNVALQMREQRLLMQQEQMMLKQQQQYAKDQAKQKDFLKKHPEAAKALAQPAAKATRKKADKKDKTATAGKAAAKNEKPAADVTAAATKAKKAS